MTYVKKSLWSDRENNRFYWIPEGVEPPEGELELSTLTGMRHAVDPEGVSQWEIDEDQAKEVVRQNVMGFLQASAGALDRLGDAIKGFGIEDIPGRDAAKEQRAAKALGIEREQLRDPEHMLGGLKKLLGGLTEKLAENPDLSDPATRDDLRGDFRNLAEAAVEEARSEGAKQMAGLEDELKAILNNPETRQTVQEATAKLKEITKGMREANLSDASDDAQPVPSGNRANEEE